MPRIPWSNQTPMSNHSLPDHLQNQPKTTDHNHDDQQADDHDDHVILEELEDAKPNLERLLDLPKDEDDDDHEEEEEEKEKLENFYNKYCRTPEDQKIPTVQSCPPTPRKPGRLDDHQGLKFVQKRKFSQLHFFETTRGEEVELFFRSTLKFPSHNNKRCKSI